MPKPQGIQKKKIEEKAIPNVTSGKVIQTKKEQKDINEDLSNIGNLIKAAKIVESASPRISKKIRGKSLTKGKQQQQQQGKPMKQAPIKIKNYTIQTAPVQRRESEQESSADESDFDNRTEIADLKKSVSAMMAKIEKLETDGNRKRRKKRKVPVEDASDSSLNSDREQPQRVSKSKPEKIVKREKETLPPTSANRNQPMHTPAMTNIPQMNSMFQQFMTPGMYSPMMHPSIPPNMFNLFPMMAAMVPQQGVYPHNLPNPTKTVKESTMNTKHSIEHQNKEHDSSLNNRTESKKPQRKNKGVTFSSEKEKDGNESDVSEVFGPTIISEPDELQMKYLGTGPLETPSFIRFVDEITKDTEKTVQSTVISSTRKNPDNTSTAKTTVVAESTETKETTNVNLFKRSNSVNSKQPIGNTSNVAGILLNLFPQKSGASGEPNSSLRQGLEGLEQPEIDSAVRTMLRKKEEQPPVHYPQQHQQRHQVPTITDIKPRKPIQPTLSYDNKIISLPLLRKKNDTPKRRYNDNKLWFRDCPNKLHLQDQDGDTVLHILIAKQEDAKAISIAKKMSPGGLDILNALGQTPLHLALYTESFEVVRVLLELGADIGVVDASGNSSIHVACLQKSHDILGLIFTCSQYQNKDLQRILSIRNNQGHAAIHVSTNLQDIYTISLLINRGADLNIQEGRTGNTPLLISLMNKNWEIATFLLDRLAHVNIPSYSNFFPLHFAVQGNNVELVKKLLQRGAEMGSRSNEYDPTNNSADEIKQLLAKEMRKRRRQRLKDQR